MRWIMILTALGLSACAIGSHETSSDFCRLYEPIHRSKSDTAETKAQVDRMNGVYVCVCEHDCPKVNP